MHAPRRFPISSRGAVVAAVLLCGGGPLAHTAAAQVSPPRATASPAPRSRVLHVAVAPGLDGDAAAGVALGIADAARAAAAQGDSVAVHVLGDAAATPDVVIAGADAASCRELGRMARAHGALVVDAWCEVPDPWAPGPLRGGRIAVLHVGPPRAVRETLASDTGVGAGHVVAWHPALDGEATSLRARWRARHGARPFSERAWRGWAAVKLVVDVALAVPTAPRASALVAAFARAPALDGAKGAPVYFGPCDGVLRQPLYVVGEDPAAPPRAVSWPATAVTRCGWRR